MRTAGLIGLSGLLASLVAAVPLEKRAYAYVTETFYEVVDVTTTITVTGAGQTSTTTLADAEITAEAATTSPPAEFYAAPSSSSSPEYSWSWDDREEPSREDDHTWSWSQREESSPTTSSSTSEASVYVPPSTTTPPTTPTPTSTPAAEYTPPPTTTSSEYVPSPASSSETPAQSSSAPTPQPTSGGGDFHGEITHYTAGMGSCGIVSDGSSENVVALSMQRMANPPNGNPNLHPNCGRKIRLTVNGVTEEATVVDSCSACKGDDVDASEVLFQKYAGLGVGRTECSWSWADAGQPSY